MGGTVTFSTSSRPTLRAGLVVTALCLSALLAALGATRAVERAYPGLTRPPTEAFTPLHIGKLDLHEELGPATLDTALGVARMAGIDTVVNLAGGAEGGLLEAQLAAARPHGARVVVFANLDFEAYGGGGWAAREAARLARARALGARGLAVLGAPGPALLSSQGEPIWRACADLGWPVILGEVGTLEERLRLVEQHPRVEFVAARAGGAGDDTLRLLGAMDRFANLWLDTALRLPDLGRAREAVRPALLAHANRILFGSGLNYLEAPAGQDSAVPEGLPVLFDRELHRGRYRRFYFENVLRFLETRDVGIPAPDRGRRGEVEGVGLPLEVLKRLYRRNAERLLGLASGEP